MREKICALALTFVLVLTSIGTAFAAEPPNDVQSKLALIEQDTYGREQTGALIDRINRLERDYDGAAAASCRASTRSTMRSTRTARRRPY